MPLLSSNKHGKKVIFLHIPTLTCHIFIASFVPECQTRWFDYDDPSGNGDYELLRDLRNMYPGEICPQPIAVEVQTVSGEPASNTSRTFLKYDQHQSDLRNKQTKRRRRKIETEIKVRLLSPLCCSYDATSGFSCVNADQERGVCEDYRIRFTCPAEFCEGVYLWVKWLVGAKYTKENLSIRIYKVNTLTFSWTKAVSTDFRG